MMKNYEMIIEMKSGKGHLYKVGENRREALSGMLGGLTPKTGKWIRFEHQFINLDNVERVEFREIT